MVSSDTTLNGKPQGQSNKDPLLSETESQHILESAHVEVPISSELSHESLSQTQSHPLKQHQNQNQNQPHSAVGNQLSSYLQYYHNYGANQAAPTYNPTTPNTRNGSAGVSTLHAPNHTSAPNIPNSSSESISEVSKDTGNNANGPNSAPNQSGFYTYRNPNYQYTSGPLDGATTQTQYNYQFKAGRPKSKSKEQLQVRKFSVNKPVQDTDSKKHDCTFPGCKWSFSRQSDLRRHAKSHSEPMFHCPYWNYDPTCHRNGGAFNRLDVLKRHLRLVHFVKDKQQLAGEESKEDPGWCRSCQRMFPNSKIFIDHCLGCAQQLTPTEWKSADGVGGDPQNPKSTGDHDTTNQYSDPGSTQNQASVSPPQPPADYHELTQANHANQLYEISRIGSDEKSDAYYITSEQDQQGQDRKELDNSKV